MINISAHLGYDGSNEENQQHQLLHRQTILQCIMLNADVCEGGFIKYILRTTAEKGIGKLHFLWTSFKDQLLTYKLLLIKLLDQGSPNYGPWAGSGPPRSPIRPAAPFPKNMNIGGKTVNDSGNCPFHRI